MKLLFEIEELSGFDGSIDASFISLAAVLLSESLLCLESSVFSVFFPSNLFVSASSFEETEDLDDDDEDEEDEVDDDLELEDESDELLRLLLLELLWLDVSDTSETDFKLFGDSAIPRSSFSASCSSGCSFFSPLFSSNFSIGALVLLLLKAGVGEQFIAIDVVLTMILRPETWLGFSFVSTVAGASCSRLDEASFITGCSFGSISKRLDENVEGAWSPTRAKYAFTFSRVGLYGVRRWLDVIS